MQEKNLKEQRILLQKLLAEYVKEKRQKAKKSVTLISNEIDMTKSMWADLERGIKDPQFSTLWRVAEALNIPLSKLVKEIEKRAGQNFTLIED